MPCRTDDTRRAALDNTEPEPVLFVSADSRRRDLLYFQTALGASAAARFQLESASLEESARLDPGRYSLVVLSDVPELPRPFDSRLAAWVRGGGAVFAALGPNTALARQGPCHRPRGRAAAIGGAGRRCVPGSRRNG